METERYQRRYVLGLAGLFLLVWAGLAIAPYDRHDWLLENMLVFGLVAALLLRVQIGFTDPWLGGNATSVAVLLILAVVALADRLPTGPRPGVAAPTTTEGRHR